MKTVFLIVLLSLAGCVSLGYHQRALKEARMDERNRTRRWIKQVCPEVFKIDDRFRP